MLSGDGQHQKADSEMSAGDDGVVGGGKWIYLRDGSTLTELLKQEVGVDVGPVDQGDVVPGREGPGGGGAKLE